MTTTCAGSVIFPAWALHDRPLREELAFVMTCDDRNDEGAFVLDPVAGWRLHPRLTAGGDSLVAPGDRYHHTACRLTLEGGRATVWWQSLPDGRSQTMELALRDLFLPYWVHNEIDGTISRLPQPCLRFVETRYPLRSVVTLVDDGVFPALVSDQDALWRAFAVVRDPTQKLALLELCAAAPPLASPLGQHVLATTLEQDHLPAARALWELGFRPTDHDVTQVLACIPSSVALPPVGAVRTYWAAAHAQCAVDLLVARHERQEAGQR